MSFVDPEEGENKAKQGAGNPEEKTIFSYLERIATAVEEKTETLKSIATSLEKLAFDRKVNGVKENVAKKVVEQSQSQEQQKQEPPQAKKVEQTLSKNINNTKNAFTEELAGLLKFEEEDEYIIIRTKKFLESDNFAKIAAVVREIGGEYISAGKNTHFRIKK